MRFGEGRHAVRPIGFTRPGIIGSQGARQVLRVTLQQLLQEFCSGQNVLLWIKNIGNAKLLRRAGHQLHEPLRANARDRARPAA